MTRLSRILIPLAIATAFFTLGTIGTAFGYAVVAPSGSIDLAAYILLAIAFGLGAWIPVIIGASFAAGWASRHSPSLALRLSAPILSGCAISGLAFVGFMPAAVLSEQAPYLGPWLTGAACAGFAFGFPASSTGSRNGSKTILRVGSVLAFIVIGIILTAVLVKVDRFRAAANPMRIFFLAQSPGLCPIEVIAGCDCPKPDTADIAWGLPLPPGTMPAGWISMENPDRSASSLRIIMKRPFDTVAIALPRAGNWTLIQSDSGDQWKWDQDTPVDSAGSLTIWRETKDSSGTYRYLIAFSRRPGGTKWPDYVGGDGGNLRLRGDR
jgi:hypothetical protein